MNLIYEKYKERLIMEYIVKCSFCGETYFVNSDGSNVKFSCGACGATNSTDDIIETIASQSKTVIDGKDDDVHFEYYLKAAKQGSANAQFKIGVYYDKGKGVTQDWAKAVEWYTKAAEQGYAKAQYNLGNSYYKGEGVRKDIKEAAKWYAKAAAQGHEKAQAKLITCTNIM